MILLYSDQKASAIAAVPTLMIMAISVIFLAIRPVPQLNIFLHALSVMNLERCCNSRNQADCYSLRKHRKIDLNNKQVEETGVILRKIVGIAIPIIIGSEIMPIMTLIDTGIITCNRPCRCSKRSACRSFFQPCIQKLIGESQTHDNTNELLRYFRDGSKRQSLKQKLPQQQF